MTKLTIPANTIPNFVTSERALGLRLARGRRNTTLLALRGEMTDDASEEQDAIDMLNESANFQTSAFDWCDGDFGVWEV